MQLTLACPLVFGSIFLYSCTGEETASEKKEDMASADLEKAAETKALLLHRLDSLTLLVYTLLLIVVVLTVWLCKHRRFRFIHESGLTLVYGLIIGLVLRFSRIDTDTDTVDVVLRNASAVKLNEPPYYLSLQLNDSGGKLVRFHYDIMEGFFADKGDPEADKVLEEKATFSPEIFFNIMLPPIIFNAGYSLKKKHFFRNIGSIMMFALVGTTVSCFVIGFFMHIVCSIFQLHFSLQELLFFGALISATDPVTVLAIFTEVRVESDLFALIFGESALNDAVAIVLASTIDKYIPSSNKETVNFDFSAFLSAIGHFFTIFFGSFLLGALVGCLNALVTKFTKIAEFPLLETTLFLLMSYASFLLAEVSELTGIVAVLFCGICQAHYTYNNLSEESQLRTKQFFESLDFLSESFIFGYIGVSMFVSPIQKWNAVFVIAAVLAIVLGRMAHIYPLSLLLNTRRQPKIPFNHQHMMLFAGLRGAIAFALAVRNTSSEQRQIIYTTTSLIVILTVLFNGGFTTFMVELLHIRHGIDGAEEVQPQFQIGSEEGRISTENEQSGQNPWDKSFLPRKWYNFDAYFMKPLLTHATPSLMETMPDSCLPLSRLLTTTEQLTLSSANRGGERNGGNDGSFGQGDGNVTENPLSRCENINDRNINEDLQIWQGVGGSNV